ncbi:unnamed protein product [Schistocephalus solidus]|uniref:Phosphoinositide phospholipase C beta 1-4-like EF-hand domain-containing protein n=1 Tax=Schistocephalus solidus TaxID=70667 RepID=A0A183T0B7_SCHSO|nr:unnamed protein product [Schistocephalus solidus]
MSGEATLAFREQALDTVEDLPLWLRITLTVNPRGKIPVRVVTKTFASGRNERIIFQSLKELGLPSGKNDEVEPSEFTFERFYELYHKICPRTDIEELFKSLSNGKPTISHEKMMEFLNEVSYYTPPLRCASFLKELLTNTAHFAALTVNQIYRTDLQLQLQPF